MLIEAIENREILKILFEKGLLAIIVLMAAFLFNLILQRNKLRGEAANEIAADRSKAYIELWKRLAEVRPGGDEEISPEKVKQIESALIDWYHKEAFALYMSWGTAKRYMQLRKSLEETPINSRKITRQVSLLRTQLKVDCGIYSEIEAIMPLPKLKKNANKSIQPAAKAPAD